MIPAGGLLLGAMLAASPGPVNAEAIRRGLRGGFAPALRVSLGAVFADAIYVLLVVFGLSAFLSHPQVKLAVLAGGICFLAYLGITSILEAFAKEKKRAAGAPVRKEGDGLLVGFTVNLFSPSAVLVWIGILGASAALAGSRAQALLTSAFILAGALAWGVALALMAHLARAKVGERGMRYVSAVSGVVLLGFAAWFAYGAIAGA